MRINYILQCSMLIFLLSIYPPYSIANIKSRLNYKNDFKNEKLPLCKNQNCQPVYFLGVITGGAGFLKLGQTESLSNAAFINSYSPNSSGISKIMWGAAVGEEFRFSEGWALDITTGYYQVGTVQAKGVGTQGLIAYNYQYSVNVKQYLLEAKLLGDAVSGFHVYGLIGIGAAFNMLGNYQTSTTAISVPQFESKTNYNFAYSLGVGFDYDLMPTLRLGLGYRFVGLGPADLGEGYVGTTGISGTLGQNALNLQEVILQLTYLI